MYSESELNEIRSRLTIVELVEEYVQLKKSGQGYMGLCPFHGEKTPSFHVHPLRQCFHCFGCHKGGNIFTFLSAMEGLSFPEAVQRLAKKTGVQLQERSYRREKFKPIIVGEARLLAALEWAAKYFNHLLLTVPEYRFARDYLQSRSITEKTIKKFRIGVSPKGWNSLLGLMVKRGFSVDELVQAGLVIKREDSPTQGYDRFRERLMFPIANNEGAIIGFGGRQLLEAENQPKYLNSPESPLFSKRNVLYGLFENQRGIRLSGEAVLVEGYMDVVGLFECGVTNAVATMGTAATEEHCERLRSLTRRVVTVFDPDSAGTDAWHRSVHLFLQGGLFAKDLTLPEGKDPDEFVHQYGAEKFKELCEKAPRQVTKLLKEIAAKGALSEEQRAEVLQELTPVLIASRRLPDRAVLWDNISLVLKVSLSALKEIADGAAGGPSNQRRDEKRPQTPTPPAKAAKGKSLNPLDMEFFQACLAKPESFLAMPKEEWIGGLREATIRHSLEKLCVATDPIHFDLLLTEVLQGDIPEEIQALVSERLVRSETETPVKAAVPFDAVASRIRDRRKESEIRAISAQVRLNQSLGDPQEQLRLLQRIKELRSQ